MLNLYANISVRANKFFIKNIFETFDVWNTFKVHRDGKLVQGMVIKN
jgi:hypothetical protein